ncbi:hypothetical protein RSAG8_00961, partial [Rhizoctonia solani AG-8 WAC10335]
MPVYLEHTRVEKNLQYDLVFPTIYEYRGHVYPVYECVGGHLSTFGNHLPSQKGPDKGEFWCDERHVIWLQTMAFFLGLYAPPRQGVAEYLHTHTP